MAGKPPGHQGLSGLLFYLLYLLILTNPVQADAVSQASASSSSLPVPASCSFSDMQSFFQYAHENDLNITTTVEVCQNLCILTFGTGNPDLSGIGMMYAYSFGAALTLIFGPFFRTAYLIAGTLHLSEDSTLRPVQRVLLSSADLQIVFWEANGFLIAASAVATLVRLAQQPTIFEVAEMQALMLMQLCSLVIIFFCLVQPVSRWWQRFGQFVLGFVLATVALSLSNLGAAEIDWLQAGEGCNSEPAYKHLSPVPIPAPVVYVTAVLCIAGFVVQSVSTRYPSWGSTRLGKTILHVMTVVWIVIVVGSIVGMFIALRTLWSQRSQLRSVVGSDFEDNLWGFGQVAALFTWLPIPVEVSYRFNDWMTEHSGRWRRWRNHLTPFRQPTSGTHHRGSYAPAPASTSYEPHHFAMGEISAKP